MAISLLHHLQRFALRLISRERLTAHEAFLRSTPAWKRDGQQSVTVVR